VKRIGRVDSPWRSAEQSTIGEFWYENSLTGWSRIGRDLAARAGLDDRERARLLALISLSIADGSLAHFDAKFFHDFWRPVTAIVAIDTGNPWVESDPSWSSFCETPPTPEYASGHSLNGGAAAVILEEFFGRHVPFQATSLTLPGVTRSFRSFRQAALENAESRIFCGIHFRKSTEVGMQMGRQVAHHVLTAVLRPIPQGP
jgi:hypothetical protein